MKLHTIMLHRFGLLVLAAALAPAMHADTVVYVRNDGANLGGVYVSPYEGTIDGKSVMMICNSFNAEVIKPSWTATPHNLSNITGTKFAGVADAQHKYNAAAWLGDIILAPGVTASTRAWASYAIWELFASPAGPITSPINSRLTGDDQTQALNLFNAALAATGSTAPAFSNWTAYTPDPLQQGGYYVQEMLVRTPEPSALALLALNAFGLFGLIIAFRRHLVLG